jgi:biopolymer transport protein ExbB
MKNKNLYRIGVVLYMSIFLSVVCVNCVLLAQGQNQQQSAPVADLSLPQPEQQAQQQEKGGEMTFFGLLVAGGPVMIPLGLSSIIGTGLIIDMLVFRLKQKNFYDLELVKQVNQLVLEKQYDKAKEICNTAPQVIFKAFLAGIEKRDYRKTDIEAIVGEVLDRTIGNLVQQNMYINAVAVIAPMLGLLGTVTGMIKAFNVIAFQAGLGKPELLAKGVSEALITTAAGLIIAIPVMTFYFYIRGRIRNLATQLSVLATDFIDNLCFSKRETGENV